MQTRLACRFDVPAMSPVYTGAGLGRRSSISRRIFRNRSLGTATSADCNVTYRPWLTTLAPIFTNFSRSVVSDQWSDSSGNANDRFGSLAEVRRVRYG